MTDVSSWSASTSAPPRPADAPPASRRYAASDSTGQADAFDSALRDADRGDPRAADDADGRARRADKDEGEDRRKRRRGEGESSGGVGAAAQARAGAAQDGAAAAGRAGKGEDKGRTDLLGALSQHPGGAGHAAAAEPSASTAGEAHADAAGFADMLDQAAARAQTVAPGQALTVRFDARSPLQSVEVVRAPDGSVSLTLAATADAAPEVGRTLEALRRRLETRGLNVGELRMADEVEGGPVGGADAGAEA